MTNAKKTVITIAAAVGYTLVSWWLAGCAPPYRQEFTDTANKEHWTKKQELLAFAYADKIFWSKDLKNGQYVFVYSRVPVAKVAEQMETILKDLDEIQSPKQQEWRKYGEVYNLAKDFQHEEEVEKTIYTRVHAADLENQFKASLGETVAYGPEAVAHQGYNIRRIFINKPLQEAFPFKSDFIEGARKDGSLKVIEEGSLDLGSVYDHKDVDPNAPEDKNAFIWKPRKIQIKLTNYKVINSAKPADNKGNYIEGVRVVDGKQESVPCLKVFFPQGALAAIVLIDSDREGEPGFGAPDVLQSLYSIKNVQDIIRDGHILDALFAERKRDVRDIPAVKIFKIEISRVDTPTDPWQHEAKGYAVPFKYRMGDNYNVRLKFAKPDIDVNDPEALIKAHNAFLDIEWVAKEYTKAGDRYNAGAGQVIEYYRAKKEYAHQVKAAVLEMDDTKKIEFELPDGTVLQGMISPGVNKFIEDKPFAVAYTEGEGDSGIRWWLEKETTDVYSKRKRVAPPKELTGHYGDEPSYIDVSAARKAGPSEGDTVKDKP